MLSKPAQTVVIPGSPGVAYRPAQTICTPNQQTGTWVWSCRRVDFDWRNGNWVVRVPPGGQVVWVYDSNGKLIDAYFLVCTSTWVPDRTPPKPPTCSTIPEQPAVPAVATRVEVRPVRAWDAGANSEQTRDGDVAVRFNVPQAIGSIVGFTVDRAAVPNRERITHGLYFFLNSAGGRRVSVYENQRVLAAEYPYTGDDLLEIRRVGGRVSYWRNGVLLYSSTRPLNGELSVAAAVYASGDLIG